MLTVHDQPSNFNLRIDKVGVRKLEIPVYVSLDSFIFPGTSKVLTIEEPQVCVAEVSTYASLKPEQKGAHLSRFPQVLESNSPFNVFDEDVRIVLLRLAKAVESDHVYLKLRFNPLFQSTTNLKKQDCTIPFQCTIPMTIESSLDTNLGLKKIVTFELKGFNVCPCALKECGGVASHSQKAILRVHLDLTETGPKNMTWKDLFLNLINHSFSAPVGTTLKRPQEAGTILNGFENPKFVEDGCRAASAYIERELGLPHSVVVDSDESITYHSAVAVILRGLP